MTVINIIAISQVVVPIEAGERANLQCCLGDFSQTACTVLQLILVSERCPRSDKVRPQNRGLRPLFLSNSEWVI